MWYRVKLISDKFDWSNFQDFGKYNDSTNKKVPGKFKFEEKNIKEIVGLSSKIMYILRIMVRKL